MKVLGRAPGWSNAGRRPIYRVRCQCRRVFVVCGWPGALRRRRHCVACVPRAHHDGRRFVRRSLSDVFWSAFERARA